MKKLEELGISPTPWRVDDRKWGCDNEIRCEYISDLIRKDEKRTKVVASCNAYFDTYKPDTSLIAAAPDMYEALREAVKSYCEGCNDFVNGDQRCDPCECPARKWRAALAKASGESEVKK